METFVTTAYLKFNIVHLNLFWNLDPIVSISYQIEFENKKSIQSHKRLLDN